MDENERICKGVLWCVENGADVISLSLGPASTVFNPNDPLQLATRAAFDRGVPVIVAAGNFGPGKIQALAKAPWVISVGAVDAEDRLLSDSGTGLTDDDGPSLVSYGMPAEIASPDPRWGRFDPGTSFAAPRVAGVAAFVRACLRLIIADVSAQQAGKWGVLSEFVQIPAVGFVDTGVDPSRLPPLSQIAARLIEEGCDRICFTRDRREESWYKEVIAALKNAGAVCSLSDGPRPVKNALQQIARPLKEYSRREVGAGLVSITEAVSFLSALTPKRWIEIFCPEAGQKLGPACLLKLNKNLGALWDETKVLALCLHLFDTIRLVVAKVI